MVEDLGWPQPNCYEFNIILFHLTPTFFLKSEVSEGGRDNPLVLKNQKPKTHIYLYFPSPYTSSPLHLLMLTLPSKKPTLPNAAYCTPLAFSPPPIYPLR